MVLKVTTVMTVFLAIVFGRPEDARAQCGAWACNGSNYEWSTAANPGRVVLNTTESTYRNVGVRYSVSGTPQWSMAMVNTSIPEAPVHTLVFHNDSTSITSFQLRPNGRFESRSIIPQSSATYDLGGNTRRWKTLYTVNAVQVSSDRRLKKDVATLRYGLDEVSRLRPVTFKWKAGPDRLAHVGLIAQEVEKAVPEVVKHGTTPDEPLSMSYSELIPVLVSAIQDQQKTIDGQVARITKLEARGARQPIQRSPAKLGAGLVLLGLPGLGLAALLRRRRRGSQS